PDVHEHDVRPQPTNGLDRRPAVSGLTDHVDVLARPKHHAQPHPYQRVVIGDEDADHVGHGSHASRRNSTLPSGSRLGPWSRRPPASLTRSARPSSPARAPGTAGAVAPPM